MELPESSGENKWWFDWAVAAPKHAGDHLTVSLRTFEAIKRTNLAFFSAREYFGGIGAHAMMVDSLFEPGIHSVADYAPEAVEHMKRVLPEYVSVEQRDAYVGNTLEADLVVMDFGDMTVFRAQPGQKQGDLLEQVWLDRPQAFTITDIAARYLHLQRKSYEPLLGEGACDSYEEYLARYAYHLEERSGYVLLEGNYTRWSCVMAFVEPGVARRPGEFHKLPTHATPGLVLL